MPIHSLGYLRLNVTDIPAWRRFAGEFLAMQEVSGSTEGALHYRIDSFHHRLALIPAETPGLAAAAFQVTDSRDLDRMVTELETAGSTVTRGSKEDCELRQVSGFVSLTDPGGNPIELFHGPRFDHSVPVTPGVSAFVTGDLGMGHIILNMADVEAGYRFYVDLLGFSERNTTESPDGTLYFLGCNARQHTLGLAPAAGPGLLHFMFEGVNLDDVGRALDRAYRYEVPMMQSLGRHTNDNMVSFYVWSPDLHAVEFGYDGERVDPDTPSYDITEGAFWGHHFTPPPSPTG
ncbi:VOC family protein [Sciscionella marina]|uniref:VOC family protein n=1 Tax=Sciscionella marina TaxID=508770 RepID=UPI0003753911|nr:VOC family protein [Sciscionella marina]